MDDHIEADIDRILEGFAQLLEGVEVTDELFVERERTLRTPEAKKINEGFRERLFANAPSSDGDRILAERRSW